VSNSTRTRTHGTLPAPVRVATKRVPKKAPAAAPRRAPLRHAVSGRPAARATKARPTGLRVAFRAGNPRGRMLFMLGLTALVFTAIIVRVVWLQTGGSDTLVAAGRAQRVSESVLHAQRGTIFARDGGELAVSVPSSSIFVNPQLVSSPDTTVSMLASMLGLDAAKQAKLLASLRAKDKSFIYVARQVDDQTADAVMALNLAGVDRLREDKRTMPSGEVGRSVLGRTDVDGYCSAGLEMQFDSLVSGTVVVRVRELDA
jgi:cell division protein FtsI/penicillin-binding protein 2